MRTTLDLEKPVLDGLRRLQKEEKMPLGKIASRLLAEALAKKGSAGRKRPAFKWVSADMGAKVDIADKDALYRELDRR
jgi:hypothetical protein